MKHLNIKLRRRIFDMDASIHILPIHIYLGIKDKLILWQNSILAHLTKAACPQKSSMLLLSACKAVRQVFAKLTAKTSLLSKANGTLEKPLQCSDNVLVLHSGTVSAVIARYRKLYDMDNSSLSEFDNMMLKDVDYYES